MRYERARIKSDNGEALLLISLDEEGNVYIRTTGDVKLLSNTRQCNKDTLEALQQMVKDYLKDIPIGCVLKYKGGEYVCKKAPSKDECDGCYFFCNGVKCPDVFCSDEDRADRESIIFELSR